MNTILYFYGSGMAFFAGALLVIASVVVFHAVPRRRVRTLAFLAVIAGAVLIALSATPLPLAISIPAGLITLLWLVKYRVRFAIGVVIAWILGLAAEVPFHFAPLIPPGRPVLVVGDSLAAGIGPADEATWPKLLDAVSVAKVGATTASAMQQAEKLPKGGGIVILEIGGNDLLGDKSSEQFERDLDLLLQAVKGEGRTVAMFELPLPPFHNAFGRIQRDLAARHGVLLIPKRILIDVITSDRATSDGLHLTASGHRKMAEALSELMK